MARAALDWSRDDLAERTGVSRATVQRFENGERIYSDTLQKLEKFLRSKGFGFAEGNWIRIPDDLIGDQ